MNPCWNSAMRQYVHGDWYLSHLADGTKFLICDDCGKIFGRTTGKQIR